MVIDRRQFYIFKKYIKDNYKNYMLLEFEAFGTQKFYIVSNYEKNVQDKLCVYIYQALEVTEFIAKCYGQNIDMMFKDYLKEFAGEADNLTVENGLFVIHLEKRR